jgi:hypothetical protein
MKPVFEIAVLVTVLRQLERRCGPLGTEQNQLLEHLSVKQLEALSIALMIGDGKFMRLNSLK